MEFRADYRVRKSANLHVQMCTEMNGVAQEVLGLCSKGLISSEAKYHATRYKNFVRVIYQSNNQRVLVQKKITMNWMTFTTRYSNFVRVLLNPQEW